MSCMMLFKTVAQNNKLPSHKQNSMMHIRATKQEKTVWNSE
jgi:hypothetical protein